MMSDKKSNQNDIIQNQTPITTHINNYLNQIKYIDPTEEHKIFEANDNLNSYLDDDPSRIGEFRLANNLAYQSLNSQNVEALDIHDNQEKGETNKIKCVDANKNTILDAHKSVNETQIISPSPLNENKNRSAIEIEKEQSPKYCGNKRNRDKTPIKGGKMSKNKFQINHDEEFEDSLFLNDNETNFNYLVEFSMKDDIPTDCTSENERCKKFLDIIEIKVNSLLKVDHSKHLNKVLKSFHKKINIIKENEEKIIEFIKEYANKIRNLINITQKKVKENVEVEENENTNNDIIAFKKENNLSSCNIFQICKKDILNNFPPISKISKDDLNQIIIKDKENTACDNNQKNVKKFKDKNVDSKIINRLINTLAEEFNTKSTNFFITTKKNPKDINGKTALTIKEINKNKSSEVLKFLYSNFIDYICEKEKITNSDENEDAKNLLKINVKDYLNNLMKINEKKEKFINLEKDEITKRQQTNKCREIIYEIIETKNFDGLIHLLITNDFTINKYIRFKNSTEKFVDLIRNLEKYKDFDLDLSENKKNENKKRSGCFEEVSKNFEEHLKMKNNEL